MREGKGSVKVAQQEMRFLLGLTYSVAVGVEALAAPASTSGRWAGLGGVFYVRIHLAATSRFLSSVASVRSLGSLFSAAVLLVHSAVSCYECVNSRFKEVGVCTAEHLRRCLSKVLFPRRRLLLRASFVMADRQLTFRKFLFTNKGFSCRLVQ